MTLFETRELRKCYNCGSSDRKSPRYNLAFRCDICFFEGKLVEDLSPFAAAVAASRLALHAAAKSSNLSIPFEDLGLA